MMNFEKHNPSRRDARNVQRECADNEQLPLCATVLFAPAPVIALLMNNLQQKWTKFTEVRSCSHVQVNVTSHVGLWAILLLLPFLPNDHRHNYMLLPSTSAPPPSSWSYCHVTRSHEACVRMSQIATQTQSNAACKVRCP